MEQDDVWEVSVGQYYGPPIDGNYSIEYCVLEFWFPLTFRAEHFKCIVATTYDQSVADKLVAEDPDHRYWTKTYRLYNYPVKEKHHDIA